MFSAKLRHGAASLSVDTSFPLCIFLVPDFCPFIHKLIVALLAFCSCNAARCGCHMGEFTGVYLPPCQQLPRCNLCVGAQCRVTKLRSDVCVWGMDHVRRSRWQAALSPSRYREEEVCHGPECCSSLLCDACCGIRGLPLAARLSTDPEGLRSKISAGGS